MSNKMWIISNYYPKIVNGEEIKTTPVFEWMYIDIPEFKIEYIHLINQTLKKIFANFIYPEREVLISRLLLEEFNNNIIFYYPWLINFANPSVSKFINLALEEAQLNRQYVKKC